MGTLGCINDMMRRDKENRELRKAGKERLNETRNRLIDLNKKGHSSHLSLEQLEEIRIKTQKKRRSGNPPALQNKINHVRHCSNSRSSDMDRNYFSLKFHSLFFLSYSLKKPIRILIFVIPTWNNLKNR